MCTYVIGIDGGGSHTRVAVADHQGHVLSYVKKGGCNRYHDDRAEQNVLEGIAEAIQKAGLQVQQMSSLTAGMAGLDQDEHYAWAEQLLRRTGIQGSIHAVNDTRIAHTAAFHGDPGIVAIGGTGSLILAKTEKGQWIRNDQFGHYAPVAARFLSYDTVHSILAGRYGQADMAWIELVLNYWNVNTIQELARLGSTGFGGNKQETNRRFGQMAPLVTEAAGKGVPLAVDVCDRAADTAVVGIAMLAACFQSDSVAVSLTGSCLETPYMREAIRKGLASAGEAGGGSFRLAAGDLTAVGGALLEAWDTAGIPVSENMLATLRSELATIRP